MNSVKIQHQINRNASRKRNALKPLRVEAEPEAPPAGRQPPIRGRLAAWRAHAPPRRRDWKEHVERGILGGIHPPQSQRIRQPAQHLTELLLTFPVGHFFFIPGLLVEYSSKNQSILSFSVSISTVCDCVCVCVCVSGCDSVFFLCGFWRLFSSVSSVELTEIFPERWWKDFRSAVRAFRRKWIRRIRTIRTTVKCYFPSWPDTRLWKVNLFNNFCFHPFSWGFFSSFEILLGFFWDSFGMLRLLHGRRSVQIGREDSGDRKHKRKLLPSPWHV